MHWLKPLKASHVSLLLPRNDSRKRTLNDIKEAAYYSFNSKVAWVDYQTLLKDFPSLHGMSSDQLDSFILANSAWISRDQVLLGEQQQVNTQIMLGDPPNDTSWHNQIDREMPLQSRVTDIDTERRWNVARRLEWLGQQDVPVKRVYRPSRYIRSVVNPVVLHGKRIGFFDIKGSGGSFRDPCHLCLSRVRSATIYDGPKNNPLGHSNGLMTLGSALRECLYERLIRDIFKDAHKRGIVQQTALNLFNDYQPVNIAQKLDTVRCYAVISTGFLIHWSDASIPSDVEDQIRTMALDPAGLVLRQAVPRTGSWSHRARCVELGIPDRICQRCAAESIFRFIQAVLWQYGIDTRGNVQLADDNSLVDFGHIVPVAPSTEPQPLRFSMRVPPLGGHGMKKKDYCFFTRAEHRIPFDIWGTEDPNRIDSTLDRPFLWSHEMAKSFFYAMDMDGNYVDDYLTRRKWVVEHFNRMLGETYSRIGLVYDETRFAR